MTNKTLPKKVTEYLKNSEWLKPGKTDFLNLDNCTKPHMIFERVFVNVAASSGRTWRQLYWAKSIRPDIFADLCACSIIIDRSLKNNFKLTELERQHLMGARLTECLIKSKNSLSIN
jgi:hypothetical protein